MEGDELIAVELQQRADRPRAPVDDVFPYIIDLTSEPSSPGSPNEVTEAEAGPAVVNMRGRRSRGPPANVQIIEISSDDDERDDSRGEGRRQRGGPASRRVPVGMSRNTGGRPNRTGLARPARADPVFPPPQPPRQHVREVEPAIVMGENTGTNRDAWRHLFGTGGNYWNRHLSSDLSDVFAARERAADAALGEFSFGIQFHVLMDNPLVGNPVRFDYQAGGTGPRPPGPPHIAPPPARQGFTRDTGDLVVVCASCDEELKYDPEAEGDGPPTKRARTRKDREEHYFWAVRACGHVGFTSSILFLESPLSEAQTQLTLTMTHIRFSAKHATTTVATPSSKTRSPTLPSDPKAKGICFVLWKTVNRRLDPKRIGWVSSCDDATQPLNPLSPSPG